MHFLPDLCNDILGINAAIQLQLLCNVLQRDAGVGERDHSHAGLDDIVAKTNNESVRSLSLELGPKLVQSVAKQLQVSIPYRCN